MSKKIIIGVVIGIILIVGVALGVFFYNETKKSTNYSVENVNKTKNETNEPNNKDKFEKDGKLLFPGSNLTRISKDDKGNTFLTFETFSGGVNEFYQEELKNEGWKKIEDLKAEDMTQCMGDWGGIYEKMGMKIKVHVCGDDQKGALKDISLLFYNNLNPEDILGKDVLGVGPNCIVDGVIDSIEACDTGVSIKFKLKMKSDKIKNFRASLGSYAWKEAKNVNNSRGIVEFETPYEKGWEWAIKDATVYPTISSGNDSFDCSSSRKEVKVAKCE